MRMLQVSEAALDSIKRMGEADRAEITDLRGAIWAAAMVLKETPYVELSDRLFARLRVNTNSQVIAKDEN